MGGASPWIQLDEVTIGGSGVRTSSWLLVGGASLFDKATSEFGGVCGGSQPLVGGALP